MPILLTPHFDDTRPNVGYRRSEVDLDQLTSREPPVIDIVLGKIQFEAFYEQLPDDVHRTILKMRHEGYSVKEIARRLGVVERTVERKMAMIQFFYEELNPEPEPKKGKTDPA